MDQEMVKTDSYAKGMSEYQEDDYDSLFRLTEFEYGLFKSFVGKRVLEVGAGWGRLTERVLEGPTILEMVAIEPSEVLFLRLKRRLAGKKVELLCSELGGLRNEYKRHFDTVYSVHVMEHIADDRRFIEDSLDPLLSGLNS